jgi:preprotein translocase subunit SecG
MDILTLLLVILLFIIAILLILIVLVQDDQGDAMGGLFGGSSSSAFGSRSGNILTRTTSILGTLFVAIILGMVFYLIPGYRNQLWNRILISTRKLRLK